MPGLRVIIRPCCSFKHKEDDAFSGLGSVGTYLTRHGESQEVELNCQGAHVYRRFFSLKRVVDGEKDNGTLLTSGTM